MSARDWASLLRVSAVFSVPGDALVGATATGGPPRARTALAAAASLCLYEAGMTLNDWADRRIDAVERPDRPIPAGRISPAAALGASVGLTAAGLGFAAAAGRPALRTASALAASVWAYDLWLKNTPAGPAAMASARTLDVLLGAAATRPAEMARALPAAGVLGAHTLAVTTVSREEVGGGSSLAPLTALATTAAVTGHLTGLRPPRTTTEATAAGGAALYATTCGRGYTHAALNPSPPLLQRAVGGGIRAMIPLQASLAARAGAVTTALPLLALLPLARRVSRKVSPT
ncbi:UbiA family prenyltransferase [Streptomyces sp. XM4193]|uniref:SCO3242 family prenyltransferase n=1 Tax=Streptomyces sp. XM4193 TaxID=2929782 RepID=UPI001FFBA9AE|nr:UbiA family prenyltransferase [Streptomyces sp. XM4193]MCK1797264.1 UbiA family prenyltransferase [Streptomyces sp. XM4193]